MISQTTMRMGRLDLRDMDAIVGQKQQVSAAFAAMASWQVRGRLRCARTQAQFLRARLSVHMF